MKAFATLLDGLVFAPQRNTKLALIERWLRQTPDPDRGYGLAALTGDLAFPHAKPALVRALVEARVDPVLFALSHDFVGDLAETAALIWPAAATDLAAPRLSEVVQTLTTTSRLGMSAAVEALLDALDASGRFALLKLITGGLRVGVSARLAKTAVAAYGGVGVDAIEEIWHGLQPPYHALFDWLEGRGEPPAPSAATGFRPMMLAHPVLEADVAALDPAQWAAEWKWDGIRVQLVAGGGSGTIFSRSGDNVTAAFPDVAAALSFPAVLDGELLVVRDGVVAPFADLQQRLGRRAPSRALQTRHPAHVRLYDILFDGPEDLRTLSFDARRTRLEEWFERVRPERMDLSPLITFHRWSELAALRSGARAAAIEGLMLKRRDSAYVAGRPKGLWFKWKRDALTLDCVVMYAQRGHGKRSSFYSDYTFGCWQRSNGAPPELVPVGKAYSGFTDAELLELDRWVRRHTIERFGPVRAVAPGLVLEIAFDAVQPSSRHRSGLAMRFPRVHRIRWDKSADQADDVDALRAMISAPAA